MKGRKEETGPRRPGRHELDNARRGERARQHLAHTREVERRRLRERERERERARQHTGSAGSRLRRRIGLALAFALALGAGLLWGGPARERLLAFAGDDHFRVARIAIQGSHRLPPASVAAATGVARGARLRDVDVGAVAERLAAEPWILASRVMRMPTGTLVVRIAERTPAALLQVPGADGAESSWQIVDSSGTPFAGDASALLDEKGGPEGQEGPEDLPRLVARTRFAEGEPHAQLQAALDLCRRLAERPLPRLAAAAAPLDLRLPEAGSREGWVLRSRDESFEAVLGLDQIEERLERLARLLALQVPEAREAVRIDLRFADRAVLRGASAPL